MVRFRNKYQIITGPSRAGLHLSEFGRVVVIGALMSLVACNAPIASTKTSGPTPTRLTIPNASALRTSSIPASISLGTDKQSIQFPVRILQTDGSGSIDVNAIGDWEPGEAIYIYFSQARVQPLIITGQSHYVAIYLDPNSVVTSIVGLDPVTIVTPASIPSFSSAIILRRTEPYIGAIKIGDRATLPPNPQVGKPAIQQAIATIPIPPVGTLEPYPYGAAVLPRK